MSKVARFDGKIVSQAKNIHFKKLQEEGVVLNLDTGDYFSLNLTGLYLWEQCAQPQSADGLVLRLSKRFGVSLDQAVKDLDEYLQSLQKVKLIEISAA